MAKKLVATKMETGRAALIPKNTEIMKNGFRWQVIGITLGKQGYWTIRRFGIRIVKKIKTYGPIIDHILEADLLDAIASFEATLARVHKNITRKLGHRPRQLV